jgi:hypothetical protein
VIDYVHMWALCKWFNFTTRYCQCVHLIQADAFRRMCVLNGKMRHARDSKA